VVAHLGNVEEAFMRLLRSALMCVLLLTLPVSAAEPFSGVWKMRPSTAGDTTKQTVTIEQVADGVKVTTEIDFGNGTGMSTTYITKLDGAAVPVYSSGKVVMTLRAKKTGPNTYEGSTDGPGGTSAYKTTISSDGKTMTTEGTSGPNAGRSVFDRVK
jgi:uncharacterized protein (DUF2147 family)